MQVKCPTCKRDVDWTDSSIYRPFCSKRCRLIDLGAWFNEEHAIPGEAAPMDEDTPHPSGSKEE